MLKRIGTGMGWSDYVDTETGQEFVMDWDRRYGNEPGVLIPLRRARKPKTASASPTSDPGPRDVRQGDKWLPFHAP